MTNTQARKASATTQTPSDEYLDALKSRLPQMASLFAALESGNTPNFLDMIAAISEMVAFHTECDQNSGSCEFDQEKRSQKICRFCC